MSLSTCGGGCRTICRVNILGMGRRGHGKLAGRADDEIKGVSDELFDREWVCAS